MANVTICCLRAFVNIHVCVRTNILRLFYNFDMVWSQHNQHKVTSVNNENMRKDGLAKKYNTGRNPCTATNNGST